MFQIKGTPSSRHYSWGKHETYYGRGKPVPDQRDQLQMEILDAARNNIRSIGNSEAARMISARADSASPENVPAFTPLPPTRGV
jgi:hypothetical protein